MLLGEMQRNKFRKIKVFRKTYEGNEYIQFIFEDEDRDEPGKTYFKKGGGITVGIDQWPDFLDLINNIDITKDLDRDIDNTIEDLSNDLNIDNSSNRNKPSPF